MNQEIVSTQYPLTFTFKILTFAPKVIVTDNSGREVLFVKQKLFKLKESVGVFSDQTMTKKLYNIDADRVIDFNANYQFTTEAGEKVGGVGRQGMKSLWRAHYDIWSEESDSVMSIREEEPWKRVIEGLLGGIPILGFFFIWLLNPSYILSTVDGAPLFRLSKKPAFFEGKFELERIGSPTDEETSVCLLSFLMMVLLERRRG